MYEKTFLKFVLIILSISMCISCKNKEYITVDRMKTDTLYKSKIIHDSIFRQDSITLYVKGDTVFRDRLQTTHVYHFDVDTVFWAKIDSIPYKVYIKDPVTVTPQWAWWSLLSSILLFVIIIKGYFSRRK